MHTYTIDGLKIHSRLYTSTNMSLMAKIWCGITILALFAVLQATASMDIRFLVGAVITLAVIGWANWIN